MSNDSSVPVRVPSTDEGDDTARKAVAGTWFAGVDWASDKHDVALHDATGALVCERMFPHSGEGLAALAEWLTVTSCAAPAEIRVAIERSDGPVVESLLERGFDVRAINPKQLDRFRDRFSPAGAKDDRRDASVLASAMRTDAHAFRTLSARAPEIVELAEWRDMANTLTRDLVRLKNRLHAQLIRYYPAFLRLDGDSDADWKLALLELAPTPEAARHLPRAKIARLFARNRVRVHTPDDALAILRERPLQIPAASVRAASAHALALVKSIRFTQAQLDEVERARDAALAAMIDPPTDNNADTNDGGDGDRDTATADRDAGDQAESAPRRRPTDAAILDSMVGVGPGVLSALLARAPDAVRMRNHGALRCLAGTAPVTRQSGKQRLVTRRYACDRDLSDAVCDWARTASQRDPRWKSRLKALLAAGKTYGHALRIIADRLLDVACTLLTKGDFYVLDHANKTQLQA